MFYSLKKWKFTALLDLSTINKLKTAKIYGPLFSFTYIIYILSYPTWCIAVFAKGTQIGSAKAWFSIILDADGTREQVQFNGFQIIAKVACVVSRD